MLDKKEMREYYDSIYSDWIRYVHRFKPGILSHPVLEYYTRLKLDHLRGSHVGDLLDIGCGTAFYYPMLAEYAESITGIDFSDQMVSISNEFISAHKLSNVNILQMDMENMDFQGRRFDTVLSMDVFHHTHNIPAIIERIHKLLKPGGLLLVVEVNPNHPLALAHNLYRSEERGVVNTFPWRLIPQLKKYFSVSGVSYLQYFPYFLTKTPKRLLPFLRVLENSMSKTPILRYLSVYYVVKCQPLDLPKAGGEAQSGT